MMKDYYKILEIHPEASLEVLNNAYRALVRKYHPDLYHSTNKERMTERMQEINEAYDVLSNPASRQEYDRRYRGGQVRSAADAPALTSPGGMKKMLIWAIGAFLVARFLLRPLLLTGFGKVGLLAVGLFLLIRFYRPRRSG